VEANRRLQKGIEVNRIVWKSLETRELSIGKLGKHGESSPESSTRKEGKD